MISLHFVMIGDVGGLATYHIGDEARLEANLSQFRRLFPTLTFTVSSPDPAWTSRHSGVQSILPIGFPNSRGQEKEREALLVEVIRQAEAWAAPGTPNHAGRLANSKPRNSPRWAWRNINHCECQPKR